MTEKTVNISITTEINGKAKYREITMEATSLDDTGKSSRNMV
jgi:hypothetical protein